MAVATAMLQQDRCTKNHVLLYDGARWRLLPGDSKTALGTDGGLGGAPARDYPFAHADQWASPLYCDRSHVQDVAAGAAEPWSLVVAAPLARRLLDGEGGGAAAAPPAAAPPPVDWPVETGYARECTADLTRLGKRGLSAQAG